MLVDGGAAAVLTVAQNDDQLKEVLHSLVEMGPSKIGVPADVTSQSGHLEGLKLLIKKGAEVNQAAENGATPSFFAAKGGHLELLMLLVEKGANVNQANKNGATPAHIAAWNGHLEVLRLLVEMGGADVNQANEDGATPALFAAKYGHLEVLTLLVEKGAGRIAAHNTQNRSEEDTSIFSSQAAHVLATSPFKPHVQNCSF